MGVDDNGDVREVETFSLYGYPENIKHEQKRTRNDLPRDVHLKSLNDLVQSIVASVIRKEPYNWIICEGLSDKIYLDAYLSHIVAKRKLRILPLAGRESVRRIFEHLRLPLIDKSIGAKGRIMCIIDTDKQSMEAPSDGKEKVIELRRLWVNHDKNEVELLRSNDNKWAPETNIEDCLDSAIFVKTLQEYSADYPFLKKIVNRDETSIGRYAFEIDLLRSERDNLDKQFFNVGDNKVRFAKSYVSVLVEQNTQKKESLTWVDGLENFFTR